MTETKCKVVVQRMEMEDESVGVGGGVFPTYYVQSPSTISHANSCNNNLSRSSSRASNNNNINNNITTPAAPTTCRFDHHQYPNAAAADEIKRLINSSSSTINEYGSTYYGGGGGGWWKYLSFSYSPNSTAWIILQVTWRFLLSLGIALLVFYMATKPPNPNISIKVSKVREYEVGEGVDGTGVSTKILNCNISLHLFIHNPSNLFPLHIQPPLLQLSFGTLSLASTPIHGKDEEEEVKVERWERKVVEVEVGSKDRLMYGGGRAMEDMVDSEQGLTLTIRTSLHSSYHLVGNLVVAKFHHQALCLLVLFRGAGSTLPSTTTSHRFYDKRHRTIVYNTTCLFIPT